ncbi:hypothetical protein LCGC14_1955620 [marine sediment metagenome]|uniref:Electron transfer flavoprotein alpha/beta-subunit N-terminal domain-containing protein n=1 Tax=marine sediment metagenome TaxID=412755 RepID=A0A0F9FG48_9ZZZZ
MILIFIEVREGKVKKSSLEALSEGKRRAADLNTEVNAVLVGHNLESLASEVLPYGGSKVYVVENSLLSHYSAAGFSQALFSRLHQCVRLPLPWWKSVPVMGS